MDWLKELFGENNPGRQLRPVVFDSDDLAGDVRPRGGASLTDSALFVRQSELASNFPGLPAKSIAAIVGNATQESRCLPVTVGPKDHGSDGLFQWRLDRLDGPDGLRAWAFGQGLPWDTIGTQAKFFVYECQKYYPGLWKDLTDGTKSVETLTANIMALYERPAAKYAALDARIRYAKEFLAQWEPPTPAPVPPIAIQIPAPVSDTAVRRSAVLDAIAAMRASLIEALASYTSSINAEVAILDATKADFDRLSPLSPADKILANQKAGTMNGSKAAITSTGVWGGVIAAASPLIMMLLDAMGKSPDPKIAMAASVLGGIMAIIGRMKAADQITGILKP